jgi:hypothetical protein
VTAAKGDYDDAINHKKNEFWLFLMELWGGLAPEGMKLFNLYKERAKAGVDRTEYATNDAQACTPLHYAPHWTQLLSAAAVIGDAERALAAVDRCRSICAHTTPRRSAAPARASAPVAGL